MGRADTGPRRAGRPWRRRSVKLMYDEILKTRVVFGTAVKPVERLSERRDELGLDGIVAERSPGGLLSTEQMHGRCAS